MQTCVKHNLAIIMVYLCFLSAAPAAFAQGQVTNIPQTVGPITCINAATAPATSSNVVNAATYVPNGGQISHSITWTTNGTVTGLQVELDGSDDSTVPPTNWVRISDIGTSIGSGGVTVQGIYKPKIRCNVVAIAGGGSVTVKYSATASGGGPTSGVFSIATNTVTLAVGAPANGAGPFTFPTPGGSTGGTINFQCTTCPNTWTSAPVIEVFAGPDSSHLFLIYKTSINNIIPAGSTQEFNVTNLAAALMEIVYIQGDVTAATFDLTYSFGGTAPTALGPPSTPPQTLFKCNQEAAISINVTGSGTTTLVAGVLGETIYVCHIDFKLSTPVTIEIEQGTGGCAAGLVGISGLYPASDTFVMDYSPYSLLFDPIPGSAAGSAYDLCLFTGATVTGGGFISYAQGAF